MYKEYITNKLDRDYVRKYFWAHKLTYKSVLTDSKIKLLADLINKHLNSYNEDNDYPYFLRVIKSSTKVVNGKCFIRGKGYYFSEREVVSFNSQKDTKLNKPHFIGISGEADDCNVQPILRAMIEWIDLISTKGVSK